MYHPFIFAVLEFLMCSWYVVDILYMMPYSVGVNSMCVCKVRRWVLHFTQFIPFVLTYIIPPSGVNMKSAVCKGEGGPS
jgi:hypothetical protein